MRRWLMFGLGLAGVVFCSLLVWSLVRQTGAEEDPSTTVSGTGGTDGSPGLAPLPASEATEISKSLLAAEEAFQIEPLIHPGELSAVEALRLLERYEEEGEGHRDPVWLGSLDSLGKPIEGVVVRYNIGSPRLICLTPNEQGQWRVDFDAFAQHCSPPVEVLASGKAPEGTVRVFAATDTYYNGTFSDESKWACYSLRHPAIDETLYGYCERGGPQEAALEAIQRRMERNRNKKTSSDLGRSGAESKAPPSRVTLRLKRPIGAADRQFQIETVLSDDWVISDPPLDEVLRARGE
ncbi:hypothetical protein [Haloferula helveola]